MSAVSKLFEHVGLTTVFGLLKYDDRDVRLHAVKVIANLAAEEENQVNIVAEGGLEALFELLAVRGSPTPASVCVGSEGGRSHHSLASWWVVGEGLSFHVQAPCYTLALTQVEAHVSY